MGNETNLGAPLVPIIMLTIFPRNFIAAIMILAGVFLVPLQAVAAEITFNKSSAQQVEGGGMVIDVRIDPQSKTLNVVEGVIRIQGAASTTPVNIDIEDSVLTMWPLTPTYTASENLIRFTGGVPHGFSQESLLFRVHIAESSSSDEVSMVWESGTAYLNDGKGTKEAISAPSGDTQFPYSAIILGLVALIFISIALRYVFTKNVEK